MVVVVVVSSSSSSFTHFAGEWRYMCVCDVDEFKREGEIFSKISRHLENPKLKKLEKKNLNPKSQKKWKKKGRKREGLLQHDY